MTSRSPSRAFTPLHVPGTALSVLIAPLLVLTALPALGGSPVPDGVHSDAPPPESSSQLRVQLELFGCDVWGGDGENLPTIFSVILGLRVHNEGPETARITGLTWSLRVGDGGLGDDLQGAQVEIPPGGSRLLPSDSYLPLARREILREDVETWTERTTRRIAGQVAFESGGRSRIAPFTVEGRWRSCFDPDSAPVSVFDLDTDRR